MEYPPVSSLVGVDEVEIHQRLVPKGLLGLR